MPAADLATQRKVPIRLIWMSQLNASRLKCLMLPSSFDRLAVFIALPVPAQQTSTRFLAVRRARLGEAGIDALVAGHVDLAEDAADFLGDRFAFLRLHVEDRDLDALRRERPRGRRAEAGGAAGDDGGDGGIEFHSSLPIRHPSESWDLVRLLRRAFA